MTNQGWKSLRGAIRRLDKDRVAVRRTGRKESLITGGRVTPQGGSSCNINPLGELSAIFESNTGARLD